MMFSPAINLFRCAMPMSTQAACSSTQASSCLPVTLIERKSYSDDPYRGGTVTTRVLKFASDLEVSLSIPFGNESYKCTALPLTCHSAVHGEIVTDNTLEKGLVLTSTVERIVMTSRKAQQVKQLINTLQRSLDAISQDFNEQIDKVQNQFSTPPADPIIPRVRRVQLPQDIALQEKVEQYYSGDDV